MDALVQITLSGDGLEYERYLYVQDGEVFISADICGDGIRLCAMINNPPCIVPEGGHVYLPLSWLEREFPNKSRYWEMARQRVREAQSLPVLDER